MAPQTQKIIQMMTEETMQLFEVFIRQRSDIVHQHVGSLRAEDEKQALNYARDCYVRRGEGVSIWVICSDDIFGR